MYKLYSPFGHIILNDKMKNVTLLKNNDIVVFLVLY